MKNLFKFLFVLLLFAIMIIPLNAEEKTAELITGPELRNKFIELNGAMEV